MSCYLKYNLSSDAIKIIEQSSNILHTSFNEPDSHFSELLESIGQDSLKQFDMKINDIKRFGNKLKQKERESTINSILNKYEPSSEELSQNVDSEIREILEKKSLKPAKTWLNDVGLKLLRNASVPARRTLMKSILDELCSKNDLPLLQSFYQEILYADKFNKKSRQSYGVNKDRRLYDSNDEQLFWDTLRENEKQYDFMKKYKSISACSYDMLSQYSEHIPNSVFDEAISSLTIGDLKHSNIMERLNHKNVQNLKAVIDDAVINRKYNSPEYKEFLSNFPTLDKKIKIRAFNQASTSKEINELFSEMPKEVQRQKTLFILAETALGRNTSEMPKAVITYTKDNAPQLLKKFIRSSPKTFEKVISILKSNGINIPTEQEIGMDGEKDRRHLNVKMNKEFIK